MRCLHHAGLEPGLVVCLLDPQPVAELVGAELAALDGAVDGPPLETGPLLLTGTWSETDAAPDGASGQCSVEADGTVVASRRVGQNTPTHVAGGVGGPDFGTLAAQGVSDVLPAGNHSFTVECRQNEAGIRFQTQLSAVALGPG